MTPGAIVAAVVALAPPGARTPRPAVIAGALMLATAGALCVVRAAGAAELPRPSGCPSACLIGIGTGAITTGVSTAAALSVTPERFAAAVGLNQTGRQVGGALGVAVLAALRRHRPRVLQGRLPVLHARDARRRRTREAAMKLDLTMDEILEDLC